MTLDAYIYIPLTERGFAVIDNCGERQKGGVFDPQSNRIAELSCGYIWLGQAVMMPTKRKIPGKKLLDATPIGNIRIDHLIAIVFDNETIVAKNDAQSEMLDWMKRRASAKDILYRGRYYGDINYLIIEPT